MSDRTRRSVLQLGAALSTAVLGGCINDNRSNPDSNSVGSASDNTEQLTDSNSPRGTSTRSEAQCDVNYLSFYGLDSTSSNNMWSPSTVSVSYSVGATPPGYIVVFEGDEVLGIKESMDKPHIVVDGNVIQLDRKLSGEHTIRVVMYTSIGGNDHFNADQATPCHSDGEIIQTEERTMNFSNFSPNPTTTIG